MHNDVNQLNQTLKSLTIKYIRENRGQVPPEEMKRLWGMLHAIDKVEKAFVTEDPNRNRVELDAINASAISSLLKDPDVKDYFTFNFDNKQLQATFGWKQIASDNVQGGSTEFSFEVTEGLTTTDQKTKEFGQSIGISVTAEVGASYAGIEAKLSTTLSTEFSAHQSTSHSISVNKATKRTRNWKVEKNTFYQLWQLYVIFASSDGHSIKQNLNRYQLLTYPHENQSESMEIPGKLPPEILAQLEEELKNETDLYPEVLAALEEYKSQLK